MKPRSRARAHKAVEAYTEVLAQAMHELVDRALDAYETVPAPIITVIDDDGNRLRRDDPTYNARYMKLYNQKRKGRRQTR